MKPKLFFCHLPKTAGTSVRTALEEQFRPFEVVPDKWMKERSAGDYPHPAVVMTTLAHQNNFVKFLCGHYHLSMRNFLDGCLSILILREPVQRTISNLNDKIARGMNRDYVLQSLDSGILPMENNVMCRYLGADFDYASPDWESRPFLEMPIKDPQAMLERAISNMKTVEILCLTEDLQPLERRLSQYGYDISIGRHNENLGEKLALTERQMKTIQLYNELDSRLYQAARSILG
ncbi:sulfotransferase family 2 domain-containing protein [Hoeflea sp.]|uniref:sulfotransferase family 2 domain-containing protein n=1 Tax=Hoeflea sp. TaxID=1940281 RepID=UPI003B018815